MTLKDEAKKVFEGLFGPEVAKQLDGFDNPDLYPQDFIEECIDFLGRFIGMDAARKKMEPLYDKYYKKAAPSKGIKKKGKT